MTVVVTQLLDRLGSTGATTDDATTALALATTLVTRYVGDVEVPPEVLDEAVMRTAVDLFARAESPNGVVMTAYDDSGNGSSTVLRVSGDPMYSARMILGSYIAPLGFA